MTDWVTVKVPADDRDRAAGYKPETVTWGECLIAGAEALNDALDSDPATWAGDGAITPTVRPKLDDDALDDLVAEVEAALDGAAAGGGLEYDDVKNACAAAIREELPEAGT